MSTSRTRDTELLVCFRSNMGFRSCLEGSLDGGNGWVIMANSDESEQFIFDELPRRIRRAYGW